jgi:hypothetical protein
VLRLSNGFSPTATKHNPLAPGAFAAITMNAPSEARPYRLTFQRFPEYLHVRVEGESDSYELSMAYWGEIAAECTRLGTERVLVEEDIPAAVSYSDMYRIAAELPEHFLGIAIAFVDRHADQAELNSFGELVAQNRGVSGRYFNNPGDAEAWLLAQ